jgi:hypothetical protein
MMLRIARWLILLVALVALLVWTNRRRLRTMLKDAPSGSRSQDAIDDALKEVEEVASRIAEVAHALRDAVQQIGDLLHSLPHPERVPLADSSVELRRSSRRPPS